MYIVIFYSDSNKLLAIETGRLVIESGLLAAETKLVSDLEKAKNDFTLVFAVCARFLIFSLLVCAISCFIYAFIIVSMN